MNRDRTLSSDLNMFLGVVVVLTIIGLVFIYSASSVYALEKFGRPHYFLKRQFMFLIPGAIGFFACSRLNINFWKQRAPLFFFLSLCLMSLTIVGKMGVKMHGASRWLHVFGMSVQPSEILKFFLLIYLAFFLERKQAHLTSLMHSYLPFLSILGISFFLLLKQPDFGMVVSIFLTSLVLLFVAQFRLLHLAVTVIAAIPLAVGAILYKSYRLNRILIFLNPWADAQGKGYQIIQSLIAIGSGSLWGLGISNSKQKFFYLPMQHTDFIFSIIAEETGFVGGCILLVLYALFCYFGIKIALQFRDPFPFFTTLGFVVLMSLQAVINLMVATGLVPTKGLGLPFISYGGSALVIHFCMVGMIAGFVRQQEI